jgi:hypothetical protein
MLHKPVKTIGNVKIFGNGHDIELQYLDQLSNHWKKVALDQYDWVSDSDTVTWDDLQFFVYKNWLYSLDDFMAVNNPFYNPNPPDWQNGFDGYLTDTFFSGVLIKYSDPEDPEYIKAYTFYSD